MANKIWPFNTPANYTYDYAKIEVSGGLAKLKGIPGGSAYIHCHFNESSGAVAADSSGNGRDGSLIAMEDADWIAGKLNNCLIFDGVNEYVSFSDIASFERTDPFSCDFWINTSDSAKQVIMGRQKTAGGQNGWVVYIENGMIYFSLVKSAGANAVEVYTWNTLLADGAWHHVVVTYDGSSLSSGIHIYVDGSEETLWIITDALIGTITIGVNFQVGARNGANDNFNGKIDEVVLYDFELSAAQAAERWNGGAGTETLPSGGYPSDKPTINPISSWEPAGVSSFTAFSQVLGGNNAGSVAYQLSADDGATWRYWNGSTWVAATGANYNDAATVHANIDQFSVSNEKIMFRAFLISDGTQKVELDSVEISASLGDPPVVYAGTDKGCYDHEQKKPFSDCMIGDPDGDIENATAWYDIEGSGWTQIPKGGYGTLQEAIRNFQYTFDSIGQIQCQLKIIDEQTKETVDEMVMTVQKYTVTFNIKNSEGSHLPNISCNFDDGQGWQIKHSPFAYSLEWRAINYLCFFDKAGYVIQSLSVAPSVHTENITLQIPVADPAVIADAVWDEQKVGHTAEGSFGKSTGDIEAEASKIQPEIVDKKDDYKADVSDAALEVTAQQIKIQSDKIPLIKAEADKIQPEILDKKEEFKADISALPTAEEVQTIKENIQFLKDLEAGCWEIKNNQMIFYKFGNNTEELIKFDLLDKDGKPAEKNVFKRWRQP